MQELLQDPDAWSAVADGYDQSTRELLGPFSVAALEWAAPGPDDEVLDVACGPGTTTLLAAARARRVHAVDFAERMIDRLQGNIEQLDHVTCEVADGHNLPVGDGEFSAAFSMFGLVFFADPIAGLREIRRALRPGGRVVISCWPPMTTSPFMIPLGKAMAAVLPPPKAPPKPMRFEDGDSLAAGLREAGFEGVEARTFTPTVPIDGADGYWRYVGDIIGLSHLRRSQPDAWPQTEAGLRTHLAGSLAGVTELAMPSHLALGRRPSDPAVR